MAGSVREGALAAVRVRCQLWVYLGTLPVIIAPIKRPPGMNQNDPEASGIHRQPLKNKPRKTGLVLATQLVLGPKALFGWVHLGTVCRWLTANSCHAARARRVCGATPPSMAGACSSAYRPLGAPGLPDHIRLCAPAPGRMGAPSRAEDRRGPPRLRRTAAAHHQCVTLGDAACPRQMWWTAPQRALSGDD